MPPRASKRAAAATKSSKKSPVAQKSSKRIAPEQRPARIRTFYGLLGLRSNGCDVSAKDIRAAYFRRAREWHPDKQWGDEAAKEMATEVSMLINEAMMVAKKNMRMRGEM